MNKNFKSFIIIIIVLFILACFKILTDKKYYTGSDLLFNHNIDQIKKLEIYNNSDTTIMNYINDHWEIINNDTLEVIENKINDFSNKVLKVKKETLISNNKDNWNIYSVDDSNGMHLKIYTDNNKILGHYIFGRSKKDWAHNYVRTNKESDVYLTSENVLRYINTNQNFWGSVPKPIDPQNDSLGNEIDTLKFN